VGEENLAEGEPHAKPHHLPLTALPAVEEHGLAFPLNGESGHVSLDGGGGSAGAKKGDAQHAGKIQRGREQLKA